MTECGLYEQPDWRISSAIDQTHWGLEPFRLVCIWVRRKAPGLWTSHPCRNCRRDCRGCSSEVDDVRVNRKCLAESTWMTKEAEDLLAVRLLMAEGCEVEDGEYAWNSVNMPSAFTGTLRFQSHPSTKSVCSSVGKRRAQRVCPKVTWLRGSWCCFRSAARSTLDGLGSFRRRWGWLVAMLFYIESSGVIALWTDKLSNELLFSSLQFQVKCLIRVSF